MFTSKRSYIRGCFEALTMIFFFIGVVTMPLAEVYTLLNVSPIFITLAGIHSMWYNMFELTHDYVQRGMTAYIEKVQEPEFVAVDRGYTFASHQQEVGAGYFDDVTTVIQGGQSSVTALTGSTEEEQFDDTASK